MILWSIGIIPWVDIPLSLTLFAPPHSLNLDILEAITLTSDTIFSL